MGVGVCGVFVGVGVYRWCFESAPEFVGLCVVCTIIDFYDSNFKRLRWSFNRIAKSIRHRFCL